MSTRCQVQIIEKFQEKHNMITLYHHSDGYPEYMVPVIYKAYICEDHGKNEKTRAGKVARLLCYADPMGFVLEQGNDLRGDIEYLYQLYCHFDHAENREIWEIDIFKKDWDLSSRKRLFQFIKNNDEEGFINYFEDENNIKKTLIEQRQKIESLFEIYGAK
jgi:hypothetical protein